MLFTSTCDDKTPKIACHISPTNQEPFGSNLEITTSCKPGKKVKYLGKGAFNFSYSIGNQCVLRLTSQNINEDDITNELDGLRLQALMSNSEEGEYKGFHCPFICRVYDFGKFNVYKTDRINKIFKKNKFTTNKGGEFSNDRGAYGILEFLEGGELFYRIDSVSYSRQTPSSKLRIIREVVKQVLLALECMHSHGYCHLDLKFENILLSSKNQDDYSLKLIDFGFTYKFQDPDEPIIETVGTANYVSPEMFKLSQAPNDTEKVKRSKKITGKCDIWALGVMIVIMLTFNMDPDVSEDSEGTYYKYTGSVLDEIKRFNTDLYNLVSNMLKVNPDDRWSAEKCLKSNFIKSLAGGSALSKNSTSQLYQMKYHKYKKLYLETKYGNSNI